MYKIDSSTGDITSSRIDDATVNADSSVLTNMMPYVDFHVYQGFMYNTMRVMKDDTVTRAWMVKRRASDLEIVNVY